jgi:signal transduction histidine kinase
VPILFFVLFEAGDLLAERILTSLSEGGLTCRVHRAACREELAAALAAGPADALIAGSSVPGCAPLAVLAAARALAPAMPVVFVVEDPLDDAFDWLAAGAAACVPVRRLDRLPAAVSSALAAAARLREAERGARRRDELLHRAVHELRTPLNALLGWTTLLASRRLDEAARARALVAIERNARAEARLVDELLDAAKILAGAIELDLAAVEICPAVAAAVEAARPAAEAAGVSLAAELDEQAGAVVADAGRLQQILRALLDHAREATPRGGQVVVRLSRAGDHALLAVRDAGRDLDPASLDERTRRSGLGVGLWAARRLVEAHGGTLRAAVRGDGAVITVELPAVELSAA